MTTKASEKKATKSKTSEQALLLISGGIDSPVAGKMAQEKFKLKAIHFSQAPFTDDTPERKSLALCKKLGIEEMIVVEAGDELKKIADTTFREYYFVLMKRFMMMVSERIAKEKGIKFLVTGESLGQVSSQTLTNLNTINQSTKIEILRPLMFKKKQEIIDLSLKWGFYDTSKGPEMCDALATGRPRTMATIEEITREEEKCEMPKLVEEALKKTRIAKSSESDYVPDENNQNICK